MTKLGPFTRAILALVISVAFISCNGSVSEAVPAYPGEISILQPNGTTFEARLYGDEFANWSVKADDDSVIVEDQDGFWKFAKVGNGKLMPSQARVGIEKAPGDRVTSKEWRRLLQSNREDQPMSSIGTDPLNSEGTVGIMDDNPMSAVPIQPAGSPQKVLVLLINFTDTTIQYTDQAWKDALFGDVGATVKNYFKENSAGAFYFTPAEESYGTANDGVIKVSLNYAHPNTGTARDDRNRNIVKDALIAADPYINFASFDINGNGYLESKELHVVTITAGYERSCGVVTPNVWGHRWSLWGTVSAPQLDGKYVSASGYGGYTQQGEIHAAGGNHMATVGLLAHELAHNLGMFDEYNTDSGATVVGVSSLMDVGSWGTGPGGYIGSSPAHLDPWGKIFLGFTTPIIMSEGELALKAASTGQYNVLRVNTPDPNQYFLLENRNRSGFDNGLYYDGIVNGGIAIWHIDEGIISSYKNSNKVNGDGHNPGVWLEKAVSNSDPYFRSDGAKSVFNETSTPNSKLYSGETSNVSATVLDPTGTSMRVKLPTNSQSFAVVGSTPQNSSSNYSVDQNVIVNFNKNVSPGIDFGKIVLKKGTAKLLCNIYFEGQNMVVDPVEDLVPDYSYTLILPQYGVKDPEGFGLTEPFELKFNTPDSIAPVVKKVNPTDNKVNVPLDQAITITFSEPVKAGAGINNLTVNDGVTNIARTVSFDGSTLTIVPTANFKYNTLYTVTIPTTAITDMANNQMAEQQSFGFTSVADKAKPMVMSTTPLKDAKEVPVGQELIVSYSENISPGPNLDGLALKLGTTIVDCNIIISATTLRVVPQSALDIFRQYTLSIPAGAVVDQAGNPAGGLTLKFTTTDPKPNVVATDPMNKAVNVPLNKAIKITFDENVLVGPNIGGVQLKQGTTLLEQSYSISGNSLIITPTQLLATDGKFTLYVPAGAVQDADGNDGEACKILFNSVETVAPVVAGTYPVDTKINIPLDKDIVIKFKEEIQAGANWAGISLRNGALAIPTTKTVQDKVLTITPVNHLAYNTAYTVTVPAGAVKDMAGNSLGSGLFFGFTTKVDKDKPQAVECNIENNAINVAVDQVLTIKFSEPVVAGANMAKAVLKSGKTIVSFNYSINVDTLTITPVGTLEHGAKTMLTLPGGALTDAVGNASKPFKLTITTIQNTEVPTVTSTNPEADSIGVAVGDSIVLNFNKNLLKGINAKYIVLKEKNTGINVLTVITLLENTVTLKPRVSLMPGTDYELYIPTGAFKDIGGNPSASFSMQFTTG